MLEDHIEKIERRFESGNSTPVERAHITAEEWQAIKKFLPRPPSSQETAGQKSG
jgi:hypothetical protein